MVVLVKVGNYPISYMIKSIVGGQGEYDKSLSLLHFDITKAFFVVILSLNKIWMVWCAGISGN